MPKLSRFMAVIGIGIVVVLIVLGMVALLNPRGLIDVISLGRVAVITPTPVSSNAPRATLAPPDASATAAAILELQPFANSPTALATPAPTSSIQAVVTQPASAPPAPTESADLPVSTATSTPILATRAPNGNPPDRGDPDLPVRPLATPIAPTSAAPKSTPAFDATSTPTSRPQTSPTSKPTATSVRQ